MYWSHEYLLCIYQLRRSRDSRIGYTRVGKRTFQWVFTCFTFLTTVFKIHFIMQYFWEGKDLQDIQFQDTLCIFSAAIASKTATGWPLVKLLRMQGSWFVGAGGVGPHINRVTLSSGVMGSTSKGSSKGWYWRSIRRGCCKRFTWLRIRAWN